MRSLPRRAAVLAGATLVVAALSGGSVLAQDPTDAAASLEPVDPCGILSAEEVSTAFGEPFTLVSGDPSDCAFDGDFEGGRYISLYSDLSTGTAAEISELMCSFSSESPAPGATVEPCAIDVQVGGRTAVYLPDAMGTLLYVEVGDGGLFNLQLVGDPIEGVDAQASLVSLAELAIPRLDALPVETPEPEESFASDPDLEALFPADVAGSAMDIETRVGSDTEMDPDDPTAQAFMDALAGQGKSIDDLSIGFASTEDGSAVIVAVRVRGADISGLVPDLLGAFLGGQEITQTPTQVAGKDVSEATVGGSTSYIYPHDDILWLVQAEEPALTEVFQKLP